MLVLWWVQAWEQWPLLQWLHQGLIVARSCSLCWSLQGPEEGHRAAQHLHEHKGQVQTQCSFKRLNSHD